MKVEMKCFKISGEEYEKLKVFQEKHAQCREQFPNMTGAQYEYSFIEDGLGIFKKVKCCCGKHIHLDGDYDLDITSKKTDFQNLTDDEKTRHILRYLLSMKKRPKMFMNEPSYDKLCWFLGGYAWGVYENKETDGYDVICWSEIEQYVNDLILPEVYSKRHTDAELFFIFFDMLEKTIIDRFPQYKELFWDSSTIPKADS